MKAVFVLILLLLALGNATTEAKTFKVATYNVENLFDLVRDGTEYTEYLPNNRYGWTRKTFDIKVSSIAQVINDIRPDVVMLQEIESKSALISLRDRLRGLGSNFPYLEIADTRPTPVKCAVLSKFPIVKKKEIAVDNEFARNILKVTLDISGNYLILFVNHWKSKQGPESLRIAYAKMLKQEIDKLGDDADFVLGGDFNSNYNEYKTFRNSGRLNDTGGITGINNILMTIKDSKLVDEEILTEQTTNEYLYNLWLEIKRSRRWSNNFFGDKGSLDNIIVSKGLYDDKGISYIDNSFNKFDPDYLFKGKALYRWQRTKRGKGRHLGQGYSDHLAIYAYFSTESFCPGKNNTGLNDTSSLKPTKAKSPQALLGLNTASREELMSISGIGPVLSARIVAGRPYKKVGDILKVKGIGPKKLKTLRPYFIIKK